MLKSSLERLVQVHMIEIPCPLEMLLICIRLERGVCFPKVSATAVLSRDVAAWRMTEKAHVQAAHPVLYQSKDLQNFLEASEDEWAMDMARANHESSGGNPAQKTLNNTLAKLKLFGQQTVAGGKHADEEEDPEYLKVLAAMLIKRCHWPS